MMRLDQPLSGERPVAAAPATVSRMRRQKRRDTRPELLVRRELHRRGWRYYVDRAPLPRMRRRADLVFPKLRVAVYVDGCFWHACPEHGTVPKNNRDWWLSKFKANADRDRDTGDRLRAAGWSVVRVWEHEDVSKSVKRVEAVLVDSSLKIYAPTADRAQSR